MGQLALNPEKTTSRSALQEDINSIFATGFFSDVRAVPEDTPLGVRVTFVVRPNPVFTQCAGASQCRYERPVRFAS